MSKRVTFKSAIDAWYWAVVLVTTFVMCAMLFVVVEFDAPEWSVGVMAFVGVVSIGLPIWLALSTVYEIRDTDLLVRSGPFRWKINLEDIRSIQPSHSLISSPALSLDRLEIRYGSGQVILISPKDHAAFIDQLATSTEFI